MKCLWLESRHNPSFSALHWLHWADSFSNVIGDFIWHLVALQLSIRCLWRRVPQAEHPSNTNAVFVIAETTQRRCDRKTTAALQIGTYAELTGGGMKELQGGTLWRRAQQSRSASLHAADKAPAMLLGNICCSSLLQVFQGASLQGDLTTSVSNRSSELLLQLFTVTCSINL